MDHPCEAVWRDRAAPVEGFNAQILQVGAAGALLMTAAQWARDGVLVGALFWFIVWYSLVSVALAALLPAAFRFWRARAFEHAVVTGRHLDHRHDVVVTGARGTLRAAFFVRGEAFVAPAPLLPGDGQSWTFEVPSEVHRERDGEAVWGDQLALVIVVRVMHRETMGVFDFRSVR